MIPRTAGALDPGRRPSSGPTATRDSRQVRVWASGDPPAGQLEGHESRSPCQNRDTVAACCHRSIGVNSESEPGQDQDDNLNLNLITELEVNGADALRQIRRPGRSESTVAIRCSESLALAAAVQVFSA
jgi:hypothetical protein